MTMTKLILVRHGESVANAEGRSQGMLPYPLSPRGRLQAEWVAERLQTEPIRAIYSSDLLRAVQTAEPLARRLGLPIIQDPRIREMQTGRAEGTTVAERFARFPGAEEWSRKFPRHFSFYGGEDPPEFLARVLPFWDDVGSRHPAETVAVFSHGWVISSTLAHLAGGDWDHFAHLNTAFSILEGAPGNWRITAINDHAHLRDLNWRENVG